MKKILELITKDDKQLEEKFLISFQYQEYEKALKTYSQISRFNSASIIIKLLDAMIKSGLFLKQEKNILPKEYVLSISNENFVPNVLGMILLIVDSKASKIKEDCDFMLTIPMTGKINSLNASVSCAIILSEILESNIE